MRGIFLATALFAVLAMPAVSAAKPEPKPAALLRRRRRADDQPRPRRDLRRQAGLPRRLRDRVPARRPGPARHGLPRRRAARARLRRLRRKARGRDRRHRVPGLVRRPAGRALRPARHAQGRREAHRRRAEGLARSSSSPITATAGPDGLGVWGGVPLEYRKLVFDRTVEAIVEASGHAARARSTTAPRPAATCSPTSSTTTRPTRSSTPTCACSRPATSSAGPFATLLELLRPRDRPGLRQHEGHGRLGPGGQPAAGQALRRRGGDRRRHARAHAAGRPRLRRQEPHGRRRVAVLAWTTTRRASSTAPAQAGRERPAARPASRVVGGALLSDPGRHARTRCCSACSSAARRPARRSTARSRRRG